MTGLHRLDHDFECFRPLPVLIFDQGPLCVISYFQFFERLPPFFLRFGRRTEKFQRHVFTGHGVKRFLRFEIGSDLAVIYADQNVAFFQFLFRKERWRCRNDGLRFQNGDHAGSCSEHRRKGIFLRRRLHRFRSFAAALILDVEALFQIAAEGDVFLDLFKVRELIFADLQDPVVRLKTSFPCSLTGMHVSDLARSLKRTEHECRDGRQKREDHVHRHAGDDDGETLRHTFRLVAARIVDELFGFLDLRKNAFFCSSDLFFRKRFPCSVFKKLSRHLGWLLTVLESFTILRQFLLRFFRFRDPFTGLSRIIFLTKHLHITAQRKNADAVFRLAVLEMQKFQTEKVEPDVEFVAPDAARLRHEKMAKFVNKNDESKRKSAKKNRFEKGEIPCRQNQHIFHNFILS